MAFVKSYRYILYNSIYLLILILIYIFVKNKSYYSNNYYLLFSNEITIIYNSFFIKLEICINYSTDNVLY